VKLLAGGRFRHFDWTLRLAPDAVFLPVMLQQLLKSHCPRHPSETACGDRVYIQTGIGLQTPPVEALSLAAAQAFADGEDSCQQKKVSSSDRAAGRFLKLCLDLLGARMLPAPATLLSVAAAQFLVHTTGGSRPRCNGEHVIFYPFQSWADYMGCLAEAGYMLDGPARPPLRWNLTGHDSTSPSLFCWALSLPRGTESILLAKQHAAQVGIFACEEHLVVTNETSLRAQFAPDSRSKTLRLSIINEPLFTPIGGKYNTALHTPIFIKAWHAVFKDAKYEDHEWTLKLDPDAVFVPHRVRLLLVRHQCGGHACSPRYISNFGKDLHGPVEVLNKQAMQVYALGKDRCKSNLDYSDKNEDGFLRLCLDLLGIIHDAEPTLLSDWHTVDGAEPSACDTVHAVFHPFKEWEFYHTCLCQTGYATETCNAMLRTTSSTTRTTTTTTRTTTTTTTTITPTNTTTTKTEITTSTTSTHTTTTRKPMTSQAAVGGLPVTTVGERPDAATTTAAATLGGSAIAVMMNTRSTTGHAEEGLVVPLARQLGRNVPFSIGVGTAGLCIGIGIGVLVAWGMRRLRAKRLEAMTSAAELPVPSAVLSEPGDANSPLEMQYSNDSNSSSAQLLLGRTNSPLRRGPSFQTLPE